jgi:hypothetical protein
MELMKREAGIMTVNLPTTFDKMSVIPPTEEAAPLAELVSTEIPITSEIIVATSSTP